MAIDLDTLYLESRHSDHLGPAYDAMWSGVNKYVARLCKDEDVRQDALTFVFENLPAFTLSTPLGFTRWIATICKRRKLNYFRQRTFDRATVVQFEDELEPKYQGEDDEVQIRTDAMTNLNPWQKQVAEYILAGYKLAEIATLLGVSHGSLRTKLSRSRKQSAATM